MAATLSCPVGAVLRSVLPFDENTSSNDQSAISAGDSDGSPSTLLLQSVGPVGGALSPRATAEMDAELRRLRLQAVDIRRTVRVKMADEADMKQVLFSII